MKRGKFWKKFCVALALLFLASLPLSAEPEIEVPELEPETEYVMMGQDIMTLYQTINDLNETKNEWSNLANGMMKTLKDAQTLCHELEGENKKLTIKNKLLVGGITVSVGICVTGIIAYICSSL